MSKQAIDITTQDCGVIDLTAQPCLQLEPIDLTLDDFSPKDNNGWNEFDASDEGGGGDDDGDGDGDEDDDEAAWRARETINNINFELDDVEVLIQSTLGTATNKIAPLIQDLRNLKQTQEIVWGDDFDTDINEIDERINTVLRQLDHTNNRQSEDYKYITEKLNAEQARTTELEAKIRAQQAKLLLLQDRHAQAIAEYKARITTLEDTIRYQMQVPVCETLQAKAPKPKKRYHL
jgi:hypothetical protein